MIGVDQRRHSRAKQQHIAARLKSCELIMSLTSPSNNCHFEELVAAVLECTQVEIVVVDSSLKVSNKMCMPCCGG